MSKLIIVTFAVLFSFVASVPTFPESYNEEYKTGQDNHNKKKEELTLKSYNFIASSQSYIVTGSDWLKSSTDALFIHGNPRRDISKCLKLRDDVLNKMQISRNTAYGCVMQQRDGIFMKRIEDSSRRFNEKFKNIPYIVQSMTKTEYTNTTDYSQITMTNAVNNMLMETKEWLDVIIASFELTINNWCKPCLNIQDLQNLVYQSLCEIEQCVDKNTQSKSDQ